VAFVPRIYKANPSAWFACDYGTKPAADARHASPQAASATDIRPFDDA